MEKNLQLQYMESSNEVDFLIYEVLDPIPFLCTLEDGKSYNYQDKEKMESNCNRIVKCVNAHEELVKALKDLTDYVEQLLDAPNHSNNNDYVSKAAYLFNGIMFYNSMAVAVLQKVTDTIPTEV